MRGKVCLITGATSGIGLAAAEELARRGATLVLVGRDEGRCSSAFARVAALATSGNVRTHVADLSVMGDVRRLANDVRRVVPRLDVLINNAGAIHWYRGETGEGIERTFALNHLSLFLLTTELLDLLRASAPSRIVNVSSIAHAIPTSVRLDDWQSRHRYRAFGAYGWSKLASLLFTFELARRIEGTGVTVNAVHPGIVKTRFGLNNGWKWRIAEPFVRLVRGIRYISPEEGARGVVHLACDEAVAGMNGQYFEGVRLAESTAASHDVDAARRLWTLSEELVSACR